MMSDNTVQTRAEPEVTEISNREYAEFIHQIELERVWLKEASAFNRLGPVRPGRTQISLKVEQAEWESHERGFRATHGIKVEIRGRQNATDPESANSALPPDAEIRVAYAVDYVSARPMTDAIFLRFKTANLPVNTWPYFREFVSSTTGRMNWQDFYMPTFKVGARRPKASPKSRKTVPTRGQAAEEAEE